MSRSRVLRDGSAAAVLALVLLAASLAAGSHAAPSTAQSVTPAAALADLNAMRAKPGLQPVEAFLPAWNDGCRLHDLYMAREEKDLTHDEKRSSRWWTAAGAWAGEQSVLAWPDLLPSEAWDDSAYHRSSLMQPRLRFAGFYGGYGYTCLNAAGDETTTAVDGSRTTPSLTLYPWPAANARDVPLTFGGAESPDPYDEAPAGTKQLGYVLTLSVNGPWVEAPVSVDVTRATLTADDGTTVPLTID